MNDYDFVVIGGGSAGYAGARTAAALGLRTAVVEGGTDLGGLCILRGCMPSKALLESATRFRAMRRCHEFGLHASSLAVDLSQVLERKNRLVEEFADYRVQQLTAGNFDLIRGIAHFRDSHNLDVRIADGSRRSVSSSAFLVASGSEISVPAIAGLAECHCPTSDDMLRASELPRSLLILGGGPVALEMASYAAAFGSSVTLIQRGPQLLTGSDFEAAKALEEGLQKEGIAVWTGTSLKEIRRSQDGRIIVRFHAGDREHTLEAEECLNALGRRPCLSWTGNLPFSVDPAGRIKVSTTQQTDYPHIFAAGDVCGPLEVVHSAIQQGEISARNAARLSGLFTGPLEEMNYRLRLFACFSFPQYAAVGATEAELLATGRLVRSAAYPFNDHGKSLIMGETAGFVKLTCDRQSGEILGGCVVGPEASELIHEVVVAMRYSAKVQDFAVIPHYHPTLSEIWTYPAEELANARD